MIDHVRFVENVTIYFLKDIVGRKKAHITNNQVVTLHVPQYEGLTVAKILQFALNQQGVAKYLPDDVDLPKVPKQWIVNVYAAVIGEPFDAWVDEQIQERNVYMQEKREMMIHMDPDMAAKFNTSTHVSRKCQIMSFYLPISFFVQSRKASPPTCFSRPESVDAPRRK